MHLTNRFDAGRRLAARLESLRGEGALVLALPRGGVPVAYEIARALRLPLDIWVSRKIGSPQNPELGLGAVTEDGTLYLDRALAEKLRVATHTLLTQAEREASVAVRRARILRNGAPPPDVAGRKVVLVDDGIATGGTMRAAVISLRQRGAARIVIAVPIAHQNTLEELAGEVDEIVCLIPVTQLAAIGAWYLDYTPTRDDEVLTLLEASRADAGSGDPNSLSVRIDGLQIPAGKVWLEGDLAVPLGTLGLVLIVQGSGSARASPHDRYVATVLNRHRMATLLVDLMTYREQVRDAVTGALRFDVELLAARLGGVTLATHEWPRLRGLPIGYLAGGTGAAAALISSAEHPDRVGALVSRGGRPDLAGPWLARIRVPTLLIVGSADATVAELNRRALQLVAAPAKLRLVEGATHLFAEPGGLQQMARLTAEWFLTYLGQQGAQAAL